MVKDKVKDLTEERIVKDECRHYWIIESASGPTSRGVCKYCGAEKEFFNSFLEYQPVTKRNASPLELPEMSEVEFEEEQNKS